MIFFYEILHIHKRNHKEQSFPSKFSIFLEVMDFRQNDLKMFISTLWYENVDDYDFLRLENVLSLKILGLNVFFNHLTKVR